ncbi:MAG: hypothetical protein WDW36_006167 [Sanguina aurantia]
MKGMCMGVPDGSETRTPLFAFAPPLEQHAHRALLVHQTLRGHTTQASKLTDRMCGGVHRTLRGHTTHASKLTDRMCGGVPRFRSAGGRL